MNSPYIENVKRFEPEVFVEPWSFSSGCFPGIAAATSGISGPEFWVSTAWEKPSVTIKLNPNRCPICANTPLKQSPTYRCRSCRTERRVYATLSGQSKPVKLAPIWERHSPRFPNRNRKYTWVTNPQFEVGRTEIKQNFRPTGHCLRSLGTS